MLNKKGIMDDWFQVIFAIFIIGATILFFLGTNNNITNKINHYAEEAIEKAEGYRILLDYLSSIDEKGTKTTDLLALAISNNDYKYFETYTTNFFKLHYKDPSKVTWMIRIETTPYLEITDFNFDSSGTKAKIAEIKIQMPNKEIAAFSLHIGKDIGVA